jgi:hypothetical protein
MFKDAINAIISGEVICKVTNPRLHNYLSGEGGFKEVNAHLVPMGRRLSSYPNGHTFYQVHASQADIKKSQANAIYKRVANEMKPVLEFMKLLLEINEGHAVLSPGDNLEVNTLVSKLGDTETARRELDLLARKFRVRHDGADHSRMLGIVKKLEDWGYVICTNAERESFQVTGKIEIHKAYLDLVLENVPGAKDDFEEVELQGSLL